MNKKIVKWGIVVVVVAAVLLVQYMLASKEQERLQRGEQKLLMDTNMIEKAKNQLDEFRKNSDSLEERVQGLIARLPSEAGVEEYMNTLEKTFKKKSMKISMYEAESKDKDLYVEDRLSITLEGKVPGIDVIRKTIAEIGPRIALVNDISDKEGSHVLSVSIYHVPSGPPETVSVDPCVEPGPSAVRYIPFAFLVNGLQSEVKDLCAKREEDMAILLELEMYRALMKYYRQGMDITEHLLQEKMQ